MRTQLFSTITAIFLAIVFFSCADENDPINSIGERSSFHKSYNWATTGRPITMARANELTGNFSETCYGRSIYFFSKDVFTQALDNSTVYGIGIYQGVNEDGSGNTVIVPMDVNAQRIVDEAIASCLAGGEDEKAVKINEASASGQPIPYSEADALTNGFTESCNNRTECLVSKTLMNQMFSNASVFYIGVSVGTYKSGKAAGMGTWVLTAYDATGNVVSGSLASIVEGGVGNDPWSSK